MRRCSQRSRDSMGLWCALHILCCISILLSECVGLVRFSCRATRSLDMSAAASPSVRDADSVHLQVISDFACPWCYVGKARLGAAIEAFERSSSSDGKGRARVQVSFSPYMIDPRTQPGGEEYLAYNKRRWGGDGWTTSLKRSSKKDGCDFANWKTWPNSLLAHRLQKFADSAGKGDQQVNSLVFQTIYERGGNASDLETLVSLAAEAGLSPADARAYLSSGEGEEDVLRDDNRAKTELGVTGVPCFIVRGTGRESGSKAPDDTVGGSGSVGGAGQSETVRLNGAVAPDKLLRAFESVRRRG
ncbi:unnamed protein product [Ectocarpus fasciculatus]